MDNFYYNANSIDFVNYMNFLVMKCRFSLKYQETPFAGCSNVVTFINQHVTEEERAYDTHLYFPVNSNELYKYLTDPSYSFNGTFFKNFKKSYSYFSGAPKLNWGSSGFLPAYCIVIVKMNKENPVNECICTRYILLCNENTVIDKTLLKTIYSDNY